jgi:uncharacterized protein (TIGR03435 family)
MRAAFLFLAASLASAQTRAAFEVASIRPTSPVELDAIKRSGRSTLFPEQGIKISGNRVTVLGLTGTTLIRAAYSLRANQLEGGPNWAADKAYNITAKAEAPNALSFTEVRQMLQTLLADRFQLKFHRDTKESSAFELMVGKSGSKLIASSAPEYSTHVTAGKSQVQMAISKATVAQLCTRLSTFLGRPVTDKTNLTGVFDLKLSFAPGDEESESASIFTAIQEQLGLKLESIKAPVEVMVIDSMEHPSAN